MTHSIKKNIIKGDQGYTLLFAVLITSIVLSVAISILSVSRKEFLLSSSARESAYAFYAADAGIECADYNDLVLNTFNTVSPPPSITCGGITQTINNVTQSVVGSGSTAVTTNTFIFNIPVNTSATTIACANIQVTKVYVAGPPTTLTTTITSSGYNTGYGAGASPTCNTSSPKRVERQLKLTH